MELLGEIDDDLQDEWHWLRERISSAAVALGDQFETNRTSEVAALVDWLTELITEAHELFGVMLLSTTPVVDIAADLGLAPRWLIERYLDVDDGDEEDQRERDASVAFESIAVGASATTNRFDDAAAQSNLSQTQVLAVLARLADEGAVLFEWSRIYVEEALGYYRVLGRLPDTLFGGGQLSELHDWESANQLAVDLSIP